METIIMSQTLPLLTDEELNNMEVISSDDSTSGVKYFKIEIKKD